MQAAGEVRVAFAEGAPADFHCLTSERQGLSEVALASQEAGEVAQGVGDLGMGLAGFAAQVLEGLAQQWLGFGEIALRAVA